MEKDYRMLLDAVIYEWVVKNEREPNHIIMNTNT
jgi:hypothetical protein